MKIHSKRRNVGFNCCVSSKVYDFCYTKKNGREFEGFSCQYMRQTQIATPYPSLLVTENKNEMEKEKERKVKKKLRQSNYAKWWDLGGKNTKEKIIHAAIQIDVNEIARNQRINEPNNQVLNTKNQTIVLDF